MSLDPPTYILSLQNNIRARPISWEGAVRARTITEGELKRIKSIDKVRKEQRRQTLEADPHGFIALFLGDADQQSIFKAAAKRQDIIQYLLVLLSDILDDSENSTFVTALVKHPDPYSPLLPFFGQASNAEDPISLLTSAVLASLISNALTTMSKDPPRIDEALPRLFAYLSTLSKSTDSGLQDIAVQEYSAVLRTQTSREIFWQHREQTLAPLVDVLRSAAGSTKDSASTLTNGGASVRSMATETGLSGGVSIQLLYHVLLVFWQISFEGELVGGGLDEEHDIIPLYVQLMRVSPKEKITRLLLATLNNLLSTNQSTMLPAATQARLPALLTNSKGRHLTDTDLLEDLENLKSMLEEYSKSQTTLDEYAVEVRSGHLRWSPPHRNQQFWKENARKIVDDNKGELPKKLAEILAKSWDNDKQVLAIGCNDIACIVKEVPDKKSALEKLGLKARVMELMQSSDESVRWEGLRAVGEWMRYSFDN